MLLVLIHVLITCVVGAILFWVIDRFVRDGRLGNLLKILVVLVVWRRFCNACSLSSAWGFSAAPAAFVSLPG